MKDWRDSRTGNLVLWTAMVLLFAPLIRYPFGHPVNLVADVFLIPLILWMVAPHMKAWWKDR